MAQDSCVVDAEYCLLRIQSQPCQTPPSKPPVGALLCLVRAGLYQMELIIILSEMIDLTVNA